MKGSDVGHGSITAMLLARPYHLLLLLLLFRLLNSLLVQTFFNPDEFWQAPEVAHRIVFGYGYLTWEWREGLRGYLHPLLFAALFKALHLLGLDTPWLVRVSPKLLQSASAAAADWFLFLLAAKLFPSPSDVPAWALLCHVSNWFVFFCSTRTFSSSLESSLTVAALYFWMPTSTPHPSSSSSPSTAPYPLPSMSATVPPSHTNASLTPSPLSPLSHPPPAHHPSLSPTQPSLVSTLPCQEQITEAVDTKKSTLKSSTNLSSPSPSPSSLAASLPTTTPLSQCASPPHYPLLSPRHRPLSLLLAAIAVVIRPTSTVTWLVVGLHELCQLSICDWPRLIFLEALPIGTLIFCLSLLLDRWMYGKWVIVPLNFIHFNVLKGGASLYGTHPWHWYFSQGLPVMLASMLPLVLASLAVLMLPSFQSAAQQSPPPSLLPLKLSSGLSLLPLLCVSYSAAHSCLGHKEFRFLLPVLSLSMILAGHALSLLLPPPTAPASLAADITLLSSNPPPSRYNKPADSDLSTTGSSCSNGCPAALPLLSPPPSLPPSGYSPLKKATLLALLFVPQLLAALYFSLLHQRGSISVMRFLANQAANGNATSVFFLMPCHSTPFFSHVHVPIEMRTLDCSPSLDPTHVTESGSFLANPNNVFQDLLSAHQHTERSCSSAGDEKPKADSVKTGDSGLAMMGCESKESEGEHLNNCRKATHVCEADIGCPTKVSRLPSHIVIFDVEERVLQSKLLDMGYHEVQRFHHAHFPVDRELQSSIAVYSMKACST